MEIKTDQQYRNACHKMEEIGDRPNFENNPEWVAEFEAIEKAIEEYDELHSLITEQDYKKALARLNEIFDVPVNTPEHFEAIKLGNKIVAYEKEHYPVDKPTPIELREFLNEQNMETEV